MWKYAAAAFRRCASKLRKNLDETIAKADSSDFSENLAALAALGLFASVGADQMVLRVEKDLGKPKTEKERRALEDMRKAFSEFEQTVYDAVGEDVMHQLPPKDHAALAGDEDAAVSLILAKLSPKIAS